MQCKLADKECKPCKGGTPLTGVKLKGFHDELGASWKLINDHHIEKDFKFPDFKNALDFTNQVGQLAEEIGHHPDIHLAWGKVKITLWTHKIDGLAEADFIFAAKIDTF